MAGVKRVFFCGFELLDFEADGWVASSYAHSTDVPAGSAGNHSAKANNFSAGSLTMINSYVCDHGATTVRVKLSNNDHEQLGIYFLDSASAALFSLSGNASDLGWAIYVNGSQVSDFYLLAENIWQENVIIEYQLGPAGFVKLYAYGDIVTPLLSWSGSLGTLGQTLKIKLGGTGDGGSTLWDDIFWTDLDTYILDQCLGMSEMPPLQPTIAGAYADMIGGVADINNLPVNMGTQLVAGTVGESSTFSFPTFTVPTGSKIDQKALHMRVVRGDATAGTQLSSRQRIGALDYDSAPEFAPANGATVIQYDLEGDGSDLNANASEYGPLTVA